MLQASWECMLAKDECRIRLDDRELQYWLGTEPGQLGILGFHGAVAAADGSEKAGRMGAGFCMLNLSHPEQQWRSIEENEALRGREIFCDAVANEMKDGYRPVGQLRERLALIGVGYGDFIKANGRVFTPVDNTQRKWTRIGREEEGTSSFRPELAALLMLLRAVREEQDVVALLDCKIEMTEIRKWIGEGSRAFLAGTANADIVQEIIETIRTRVRAGAVTLLVKVKAHRGEPMNEEADDCADIGRSMEAEMKEWTDRSERMIFKWQTAAGEHRRAAWGASVRIAMRKQGAWLTYRKCMAQGGRRWSEENWIGPDLCGKRPTDKAAQTVMQEWFGDIDEWMVARTEERRQDQDVRETEGRTISAATGSWTVDFMTRAGESREAIHKWLKCKAVPWRRRRRLLQAMTGTFPCGQWLNKIGKGTGGGCELCARNRVPGNGSGKRESESMGHIQSAFCAGQTEVVTAAHNRCNRLIQAEIRRLVKELEVVTVDQEMSMQKIWEHASITDVCSWSEVAEAAWKEWQRRASRERSKKRDRQGMVAREIVTEASDTSDGEEERKEAEPPQAGVAEACSQCASLCSRGGQGVDNSMICCQCRERDDETWVAGAACRECWQKKLGSRRFDGMAINRTQKKILTLEFKRTSDRRHTYARDCDRRATEQYTDLVRAAKKVLQRKGWDIEPVNFIAGTKSINVELWNRAMKVTGVPEAKWAETRGKLMRVLLDEHDNILRSYQAQKRGGGGD